MGEGKEDLLLKRVLHRHIETQENAVGSSVVSNCIQISLKEEGRQDESK